MRLTLFSNDPAKQSSKIVNGSYSWTSTGYSISWCHFIVIEVKRICSVSKVST